MVRFEGAVARVDLATVLLVDDDAAVRKSLSRLIRAAGFKVQTFDRPTAVLAGSIPAGNACLVIDIGLPEMSGTELWLTLERSGCGLPSIFITGQDISRSKEFVGLPENLAVLHKPIDEVPLLAAINRAIALSNAS
jgi:two-component system, LuxR family, response regulator FixJ